MWSDIYFLFLFYYTSNGQILQASLAEQRQKLIGGKQTLIGGKKLLALHAKTPEIYQAATSVTSHRWPNGQVQYYIDENSYDKTIASKLEVAFTALAAYDACPEFTALAEKPTNNAGSWLHFTNPNRVRPCVHEPGGVGSTEQGEIVVVLGYDCLKPREILHTVMHGLGFHDEVTHAKRDLFIKVMWDDIQPAFRSMFRIQSMREPGGLLDYDPKSIMHFHDHAYSLAGRPSIAPLLPGLNIEPSNELSHIDKIKIRLLFAHECKKRQIVKILDSCANNDGNINGDDKVVIPGNDVTDVKPDYGDPGSGSDVASGDNKIVIPGDDVTDITHEYGDDAASDDAANGDDDQIVVPGEDVSTIEEIPESGEVIEGDNVKISEITDDSQAAKDHDAVADSGISGGFGDSQASQEQVGSDGNTSGVKTSTDDENQVAQGGRNITNSDT